MFLVISCTNSPELLSIIADSEYFLTWSIALNKIMSLFTTLTFNFSDFDKNKDSPFIKSCSGFDALISNLSKLFLSKSLAKNV